MIFVGSILQGQTLARFNNQEKQLAKHFPGDTWSALTSAMEEQCIDPEADLECLHRMKKFQLKGDIQDYIVMIEDLNYHICLSWIAWQQALHSGLNEEIKNQISFSKITPNDITEYELLLKQVAHKYERCRQEMLYHNYHKPKNK
jgi:hypothetical protein